MGPFKKNKRKASVQLVKRDQNKNLDKTCFEEASSFKIAVCTCTEDPFMRSGLFIHFKTSDQTKVGWAPQVSKERVNENCYQHKSDNPKAVQDGNWCGRYRFSATDL